MGSVEKPKKKRRTWGHHVPYLFCFQKQKQKWILSRKSFILRNTEEEEKEALLIKGIRKNRREREEGEEDGIVVIVAVVEVVASGVVVVAGGGVGLEYAWGGVWRLRVLFPLAVCREVLVSGGVPSVGSIHFVPQHKRHLAGLRKDRRAQGRLADPSLALQRWGAHLLLGGHGAGHGSRRWRRVGDLFGQRRRPSFGHQRVTTTTSRTWATPSSRCLPCSTHPCSRRSTSRRYWTVFLIVSSPRRSKWRRITLTVSSPSRKPSTSRTKALPNGSLTPRVSRLTRRC